METKGLSHSSVDAEDKGEDVFNGNFKQLDFIRDMQTKSLAAQFWNIIFLM